MRASLVLILAFASCQTPFVFRDPEVEEGLWPWERMCTFEGREFPLLQKIHNRLLLSDEDPLVDTRVVEVVDDQTLRLNWRAHRDIDVRGVAVLPPDYTDMSNIHSSDPYAR